MLTLDKAPRSLEEAKRMFFEENPDAPDVEYVHAECDSGDFFSNTLPGERSGAIATMIDAVHANLDWSGVGTHWLYRGGLDERSDKELAEDLRFLRSISDHKVVKE